MRELITPERAAELTGSRAGHQEVEVEIGCGNGHFIASYGRAWPDRTIIGIEKRRKRALLALRKLELGSVGNAEIVAATAEETLRRFPPGSLARIHIYFPDPWPKNRHRRRRLLRMQTVDVLHRLLREDGRLVFASDMLDYYVQCKILLLLHGGFLLAEEELPEQTFVSVYSMKWDAVGRRTHYLSATKSSTAKATEAAE